MGAVRLLRILAPVALVAAVASACGSGSSSDASGPPSFPTSSGATPSSGASSSLELRPVYARYTSGVSLGPGVPKDLVDTLSHQKCPTKPRVVQDMLLECDAGGTVFLLKAPIVSGGVASATAKEIGHQKLWFVQLTLDPSTKTTLDTAAKSLSGTELAYSFGGTVVTSVIVDSSFDSGKLAIIGDYDKAQATRLASRITS
jgi:SecD-like export protein